MTEVHFSADSIQIKWMTLHSTMRNWQHSAMVVTLDQISVTLTYHILHLSETMTPMLFIKTSWDSCRDKSASLMLRSDKMIKTNCFRIYCLNRSVILIYTCGAKTILGNWVYRPSQEPEMMMVMKRCRKKISRLNLTHNSTLLLWLLHWIWL